MKPIILIFAFFLTIACGGPTPGMAGTEAPDHSIWNTLLQKHVRPDGRVNYKGFISEKASLETYLELLSNNAPDREVWSEEEQLAYWINAYNAFTVKLIVDNYPTESIRDLGPKLKIPLVNDVWHYKFFKIGGQESSLDEIEHSILRKEFEEPRIHFAINCASVSCPPLLNEAFFPEKLEAQLDKVAKGFVNDPSRNKISKNEVEVSAIFSWFKGDFTKNGSLIDFLNKYSNIKINSDAKVSHMKYDWNLNE
ncbi:DUF547 domain-containing protein [Algoriphagus sediminis]|uniref:DUF547 domain-containing protein n=1 Tax=Algoriphagus sediminis TaxID=3057113 RepID=A0ABT7Y878_9BACT|nr:DUF547 domain-containing protein [Algoriphagus sediminis]MDN3202714.1 DUF547 domain-containing protein [Algoriphagus sediminis]